VGWASASARKPLICAGVYGALARSRGSGVSAGARRGTTARARNRRFVRSVRRAGPDRPGACAANRSITDGCSSTCGAGLHGPYWQWTRKVAGKTVTRLVPDEQLDDYRQWLDNHRRLRALVAELEALTLAVADAGPRGKRPPLSPRDSNTSWLSATQQCP
jgi:hypothetical protein